MNEQIKDLWVNALQSGKYRQGKGRLCIVGEEGIKRYCCLGVLTNLYMKEFPHTLVAEIEHERRGPHTMTYMRYKDAVITDMWTTEYLHPRVMQWAELKHKDPVVMFMNNKINLSTMNDNDHSFDEIAQTIRHSETL